jgi:exopolysaccharide production protein ExoQ
MPAIILIVSLAFSFVLIRRDCAQREGVSGAIWIPTIWVAILCSRPLSSWIGSGGASDTLDGSPVDRMFYLCVIVLSLFVLLRRQTDWGLLIVRNWPIAVFYIFLLISVTWANSPLASFKRWFKEVGNIIVALVILTEASPLQAFRAVFVRCAYVFVPLSIVFIRYFPEWGRSYSRSGAMQLTGVTTQKNTLGAMVLTCGLVFIWDQIERTISQEKQGRTERFFRFLFAIAGAWLLYLSDSKTSIVCLCTSGLIVASLRYPTLQTKVRSYGVFLLFAAAGLFAFDQAAGIVDWIVSNVGRNSTFTGRTDVWRELLNVQTDPIWGTGFMSFWDDRTYQAQLPYWVSGSAHNGYLEVYLAGGYLGTGALTIMLLGVALRTNRELRSQDNYPIVCFAVLVLTVIASYTESNFGSMTAVGFLFLLSSLRLEASQASPILTESTAISGSNVEINPGVHARST